MRYGRRSASYAGLTPTWSGRMVDVPVGGVGALGNPTGSRQLPLPQHLVGALVNQRSSSQQVMLDGFFANLGTDDGTGLGHVRMYL